MPCRRRSAPGGQAARGAAAASSGDFHRHIIYTSMHVRVGNQAVKRLKIRVKPALSQDIFLALPFISSPDRAAAYPQKGGEGGPSP